MIRRSTVPVLLAALGLAAPANAQSGLATFGFEARVVEINDAAGLFTDAALGDRVSGNFAFDASSAPQFDGDLLAGTPLPFSYFLLDSFSANFSATTLTTEGGVVLVFNDIDLDLEGTGDDNDDPEDTLVVGGSFSQPTEGTTSGSLEAYFLGSSSWFDTLSSLPDPASLGLENLTRAEVIIEFQRVGSGTPDLNGDGEITPAEIEAFLAGLGEPVISTARLQFDLIVRGGDPIVEIGCRADVATPFEALDINDVLRYADQFARGLPNADIAAPYGVSDINDVLTYAQAFARGCTR